VRIVDDPWKSMPKKNGFASESRMIEMDDGWQLRVVICSPQSVVDSPPLVMVPGWNSVLEGWREIVETWALTRRVYYIETREKGSAKSKGELRKSKLSIQQSVRDLLTVTENLPEVQSECDWFASSLGATILLEALNQEVFKARSVSLLAPNVSFDFPLWSRPLIKMPSIFYPPLIRLAIFYLSIKLKEEGQKVRYRRTLLASNVNRLRLSALSNGSYRMNTDLSNIDSRVALITAESDKLHAVNAIRFLMENLPEATLIEVPSNQFAHNPEVIPILEAFQNGDRPPK
tara:strand:- start:806 stop:1669 length:864 start_codon:yes stop_codon:yes gene_type:complete